MTTTQGERMSAITTDDRWTCPDCLHTEALKMVTTPERARARLRKVQHDHGRVHADERRRGLAPLRDRRLVTR